MCVVWVEVGVAQSRDGDGSVVCYVALVALVYNVVLIKLEAARSRRREGWTVEWDARTAVVAWMWKE
jgi:hypothetical protein